MKELTYHLEGDYLIPDLAAPEAPRIASSTTNNDKRRISGAVTFFVISHGRQTVLINWICPLPF